MVRLSTLLSSIAVSLVGFVHAAPTAVPPIDTRAIEFGIYWETGQSTLPVLKLPYASYRAVSYDKSDDYYVFRNIRFAAPPTGERRWKKPEPPLKQEGVQDGKTGYSCYQATPRQFSVGQPILEILEEGSEDCLFLDMWIPGKAVRGQAKNLPVLFWIFGGGYALGSKSFFVYDGAPLLKSSGNNLIYVAPNYRLGAFGFLGGSTIIGNGVANAGFHDQRAALQWTKSYISLVGGDPSAITAMGESAGAGSIMHHLTAEGGTQDPIFRRAIMSSPAFEPLYDPGRLLKQYQTFESAAGCSNGGLACLRSKTGAELQNANKATVNVSPYGTFGYGPSIDGSFVRDLPGLELAAGHYWKDVSIIVGHNANEGILFTDPSVSTDAKVVTAIAANFPNATAAVRNQILTQLYPKPFLLGLFGGFDTNYERLSTIIQELVVTCNTRWLAQAYAGKAWHYVFSVPPGIHALDLLFTFWRTDLNIGPLQVDIDIPFLSSNNLATGWQSYLTSFVRSGNPNTYRQGWGLPLTTNWAQTSVKNAGPTSLDVNVLGYSSVTDGDAGSRCDFWQAGTWTGR